MTKHTIHIHLTRDWKGDQELYVSSYEMTKASHGDYIHLEAREIEVEMPSDTAALEIDHLQQKAERIRAATQAELQRIAEQIDNLRCLEYMTDEEENGTA